MSGRCNPWALEIHSLAQDTRSGHILTPRTQAALPPRGVFLGSAQLPTKSHITIEMPLNFLVLKSKN